MRRLVFWLTLLLLCMPAVQPYLAGDFPRTNDAATHLYRAFELDRMVRAGIFFPRWGPDFAHGYGYPTFNYFPYLSHYLIEAFHLAGLPLLWAMRAAFALALVGAAASACALAGDLFHGSQAAGLIGAAAYLYSPYLLYTANVRGGLPESLLLALLPLALLSVRRLALGQWRWLPVCALVVAAMAFSHLGGLVQAAPFVIVFPLITIYASRVTYHVLRFTQYASRLGLLAAAALLGLALPAFQWLPTRAELGFVKFAQGFSGAGIAYNLNFFRLADLFTWPRLPVDLDLLNPPLARPLPWVAVVLGLVCLIRWRAFAPGTRHLIVFFGGMFLASAFLALDVSKPIWDRIPLLQQTLWPWRFLGPASLAAAVLAGGAFAQGELQTTNHILQSLDPETRNTHFASRITSSVSRFVQWLSLRPLIALALLLLASLPWLYPPREPLPEQPGLADLARAEIPPLLVGTTTTGEYTPVWVQHWPDTEAMRAEQLAGREPDRLDAALLPEGASSAITVRNPLGVTYLFNLPAATTTIYRTFYFPGWEAALDGQPLALRPTEPEGLISFDVPAGQHVVTLHFGDTPIRRTAEAISLGALGLFTIIAIAALLSGNWKYASCITHHELRITDHQLRFSAAVLLLVVAKLALLDTGLAPLVRHGLRAGQLAGVSHPLGTDFGGELTLLGYDLSSESFGADDTPTVNLYWHAQRPLGVAYGMNVRLVDARGLAWSESDIRRPPDFRFFPGTDNWPPNQYVLDPYMLQPIPGTPPGSYDLEVVAYRQSDLQAIGTARIGQVQIVAPQRAPANAPAPEATFGGELALVSHHLDRDAAAPGDPTLVTLLWQAESGLPGNLHARLELAAGATGEAVFSQDFVIAESYPTSRWQAGDMLADQVLLRLPAALGSGRYTWRLVVLDASGPPMAAALPLTEPGAFTITAPERLFELPAMAHRLEADLGGKVRLAGYNLSADTAQPGETVTVSLVWQALADMPVSYHVFLHLTDPRGTAIVAQSDGAPANWARPTTGWVPGEVVVDGRALSLPADLPAGEYLLWAGMADPDTGERLPMPGSRDGRVRLGTLQVAP